MKLKVFSKNIMGNKIEMDCDCDSVIVTAGNKKLTLEPEDDELETEDIGYMLLNEFGALNTKIITIGCLEAMKKVSPKITEPINERIMFIDGDIITCVEDFGEETLEYANFRDNIALAVNAMYCDTMEELMQCIGGLVLKACNMTHLQNLKSLGKEAHEIEFDTDNGAFNIIIAEEQEEEKESMEEDLEAFKRAMMFRDTSREIDEQSENWYKSIPYKKGLYKRFIESDESTGVSSTIVNFIKRVAEAHGDIENVHKCDGCDKCNKEVWEAMRILTEL